MKTLSIIIPAYNEEKTIAAILQKVAEVKLINGIQKEIIVVNDCSTDATEERVKSYILSHAGEKIYLVNQRKNQGKGAAIRRGLQAVTGSYVIIQDADMESDPEDYNVLLETFLKENLKVIYGSRFLHRQNRHSYRLFYLGGRLVTGFANLLFAQHLTDEPTCYKLFEVDFLRSIPLRCTGFEFCPEVTAKVAKRGVKIREVAIRYYPRSIKEGKKIKWTDGLKALRTLLKYRFVN
ncbi:MAG: glycosyltransferase family 2 protein [Prevotellaceae bacterium]|jgi:glycosyltransferase involved in cell wall biosynthesis|nr:glycosyltransferase family 2 protein [Prevotellaceae bacterium]